MEKAHEVKDKIDEKSVTDDPSHRKTKGSLGYPSNPRRTDDFTLRGEHDHHRMFQ